MTTKWTFAALGILAIALATGCGPAGAPRYPLSGTVTYNGEPVPAGYIMFSPDVARGNDGPGAQADIKDGHYQTLAGQGTIGGPHRVAISGFDGKAIAIGGGAVNPQGNPLFPTFQFQVDLPKEAATKDFTVPAASARNSAAGPNSPDKKQEIPPAELTVPHSTSGQRYFTPTSK